MEERLNMFNQRESIVVPHRRRTKIWSAVGLLALVAALVPAFSGSGAYAQGNCQTFSQTKQQVCGKFLDYWNKNGGLAQQGYPISAELQQKSDINGKTYTTQYFERAVFEAHPENQAPYDVLLSLLGTLQYQSRYGKAGAPNQP